MLENIRLSFQGIWSHKMRSFLTMLGIIIGIASIISIVSTIQGTNEQLMQNVIGSGTNAVNITLSKGTDYDYTFDYESIPDGVPVITEETRQKLVDEVDGVEAATLYTSRSYAEGIYYLKQSLQGAQVYGIDSHYFNVNGYMIRTGRNFVDEDYTDYHKVVILDQSAASTLFQEESALGKTLEINGEPFTVVGVAQLASQFEPVINSREDYYTYLGDDSSSGRVFMPSSVWPIVYQFDEPQNVSVKAASVEDMTKVGKPCADILNAGLTTQDKDLRYRAKNTLDTVEQQQKINESTNQQLIWIASISLLVGGIGVMNIMLVSVTERTSEIGLKKAIGARKRVILAQFLTEAAVLTSMGGIVGVIAGIVMAQAISKMADVPVGISVPAIVVSVLFSTVIGVIFGFVPSIKASNLNPIDALRHE